MEVLTVVFLLQGCNNSAFYFEIFKGKGEGVVSGSNFKKTTRRRFCTLFLVKIVHVSPTLDFEKFYYLKTVYFQFFKLTIPEVILENLATNTFQSTYLEVIFEQKFD